MDGIICTVLQNKPTSNARLIFVLTQGRSLCRAHVLAVSTQLSGMESFLESGLQLERTKHGSGDKEHAYIISKAQARGTAICIFLSVLVCAIVGVEYKYELIGMALRQKQLYHLKVRTVFRFPNRN